MLRPNVQRCAAGRVVRMTRWSGAAPADRERRRKQIGQALIGAAERFITAGEGIFNRFAFRDVGVGANQRSTFPFESLRGCARVRNGRKTPSAPRRGNTISNGSPVSMECRHRSMTRSTMAGSWADCQPQPSICSGVVPVYSYQRLLYQKIQPLASAIQVSCGMVLARVRNCSSLRSSSSFASCKARSVRLRAVMSWTTTCRPRGAPVWVSTSEQPTIQCCCSGSASSEFNSCSRTGSPVSMARR